MREKLDLAERNLGASVNKQRNYARVMMDMCELFLADTASARDARDRAVSMAEQVVRENDWLYRRTVQDRRPGTPRRQER